MGSKEILEKTIFGNIFVKRADETLRELAIRQEKEFKKRMRK